MGKKPTDITVLNIGDLQDDDAFPIARTGLLQANKTTPANMLAYLHGKGLGVDGGVWITNVAPA